MLAAVPYFIASLDQKEQLWYLHFHDFIFTKFQVYSLQKGWIDWQKMDHEVWWYTISPHAQNKDTEL